MKMTIPFEKPIAFHPAFAKCFGSINKAIYIQQFIYWSDKGKREDGFVYKTKTEIEEETTLTRKQQDSCRKYFEGKGLETQLLKANGVPTLHYRVNIPLVQKALMEWCKRRQPNSAKGAIPLTESTSKNTTKNKDKYLDFVFLTVEEHRKLIDKFGVGGTTYWIAELNGHIGSKGAKYLSHYLTILNWERKNECKDGKKQKPVRLSDEEALRFAQSG